MGTSDADRSTRDHQGHPDPRGHHFGHCLADAYATGAALARVGTRIRSFLMSRNWSFPSCADKEDPSVEIYSRHHSKSPTTIAHSQSRGHDLSRVEWCDAGAPQRVPRADVSTHVFILSLIQTGERLEDCAWVRQKNPLKGATARIVVTMQMPAFAIAGIFIPTQKGIPFD